MAPEPPRPQAALAPAITAMDRKAATTIAEGHGKHLDPELRPVQIDLAPCPQPRPSNTARWLAKPIVGTEKTIWNAAVNANWMRQHKSVGDA